MTGVEDPLPLRGGTCDVHGGFNNFSGRCIACDEACGYDDDPMVSDSFLRYND
mgnify:CR=1 FL=1